MAVCLHADPDPSVPYLFQDFRSRRRLHVSSTYADGRCASGRGPRLAARQFLSRKLGQDVHLAWKDLAITATLLSRTCSYDHFDSRLSEIGLLPSKMGIAALGVYLSMERDISGNRRDFHILDDRQQTRETMDRDPRSRPK
jgi:hypothetical protein